MVEAQALSISGKMRALTETSCEDVVLTIEADSFCFYGLADGQSGKKYCTEGANASLNAAAAYIKELGIAQIHRVKYFDEIQFGLIKVIRSELESLTCEYKTDIFEFGSTLMAFAVDPGDGKYVLIHLGDGRVVGIRNTGELKNISPPENGLCLNQTWLTTSPHAASHTRVYVGNINNYQRIILMSDGADGIFQRELYGITGRVGIFTEEYCCDMLERIATQQAVDDSSYIIINNCTSPFNPKYKT